MIVIIIIAKSFPFRLNPNYYIHKMSGFYQIVSKALQALLAKNHGNFKYRHKGLTCEIHQGDFLWMRQLQCK